MKSTIKQYPTPIAGLTLGIAGICVFWSLLFPQNAIYVLGISFLLVSVLLVPLLWKFARYPHLLHEDLKHATVGSTVPTIAMTLMYLSHTLGAISILAAILLWCIGLTLHVSFFILFSFHRIKDFAMHHIVPSWFVPPIGMIVACLTIPAPIFLPIVYVILAFGMTAYALLLPIVLYRLCLHEKIEDARKPTLAVLAAPASLTLAGYLSTVSAINPMLAIGLYGIALLMTATVYLMLFHLIKLPFSPAFSAYTFPLAISTTATFKMSLWTAKIPLLVHYSEYLHWAAIGQALIASVVIIYVIAHYGRYLKKVYL